MSFLESIFRRHDRCELIIKCEAVALAVFQLYVCANDAVATKVTECIDLFEDELKECLAAERSEQLAHLLGDDDVNELERGEPATVLQALKQIANRVVTHASELVDLECLRLWDGASWHHLDCLSVHCGRALDDSSLAQMISYSRTSLRNMCALVLECGNETSRNALGSRANDVVRMFVNSGLLSGSGDQRSLSGTGLQFCMSEVTVQWWTVMEAVMDDVARSTRTDRGRLLQYLAIIRQLDCTKLSFQFPPKETQPVFHNFISRLVDVGLVLEHDNSTMIIISPFVTIAVAQQARCPWSRMALADKHGGGSQSEGFVHPDEEDTVITETNLRIFAYTRNSTLISVIDQFAQRENVVGGWLVCARLTREKFVSAVGRGITASQVLQFLTIKAHPAMKRRAIELSSGGLSSPPVVPQTIADQLHMWEAECRRIEFADNVVLLYALQQRHVDKIERRLESKGFKLSDAIVDRTPSGGGDQVQYLVVTARAYIEAVKPLMME